MNELVVFDPVKAELAEYKKENASLVFDYEDPQGNKDARSHIYKLRQAKTKIADIHKEAKAVPWGICKLLDGEKNDLTAEVETMIDFHYKPVKEIEEREVKVAAVKANEERLERIRIEAERVAENERREDELAARENAAKAKEDELAREAERLEAAKQAETDKQAAVKEAQEQAGRDKVAAAEQAEQNKKDALAAAEAAKQAAVEAEKEKGRQVEFTRERKHAAEQAELDRKRHIEATRIANESHRHGIETRIEMALMEIETVADELGKPVIEAVLVALIDEEIPHVKIIY